MSSDLVGAEGNVHEVVSKKRNEDQKSGELGPLSDLLADLFELLLQECLLLFDDEVFLVSVS